MIYVSSAGLKNQPAWKTCFDLFNHGINNIELSGGCHDPDQLINLKKFKNKINFQIHNYFPPPAEPFVFNLASLSPDIIKKSLDHVETALQFSIELDCQRYSFHAGFLLDPQVSELGRSIKKRELYDRNEATKIFLENINIIADKASKMGISLLIENNVLSSNNFAEFKCNPLLMTEAEECIKIMNNSPSNVNLLLDLAHLNVSSKTIGFDKEVFINKCSKYIDAYHLSDNNEFEDNNNPISKNSWFWRHLKKNVNYFSLEIYGLNAKELNEQFKMAKIIIEKND